MRQLFLIFQIYMFVLPFQLNQASGSSQSAIEKQQELNGFIAKSPIYVTSINGNGEATAPICSSATLQVSPIVTTTIPNGHASSSSSSSQDNTSKCALTAVVETTSVIIETKANHIGAVPPNVVTPAKTLPVNNVIVSVPSGLPSVVGLTNTVSEVTVVSETATSPVPVITNGRTEKLLGEQPENRRTSTSELIVGSDTRSV